MRVSGRIVASLFVLAGFVSQPTGALASDQIPGAKVRDLAPGVQYNGGERVRAEAEGIAFQVPAQWLGGIQHGASAFMLGSEVAPGVGIVILRQKTSIAEARALLEQPQDLGGGVVLTPGGTTAGQNDAEVSYQSGAYVGFASARIGPAGNGIAALFAGPREHAEMYQSLAGSLAESVVFADPTELPAQRQWKESLAGMMLKRMDSYYSGGLDGSYAGGSSSETLHLCSDGSYSYHSSSSFSVDGGTGGGYNASGAGQNSGGNTGAWVVEMMGSQVVLTLNATDGQMSQHTLAVSGEQTLVDGERAFRVPSDRCR